MDSPYLYKLPADTKLFRATTVKKEGRWYNLSLENAYTYGENITEYKTLQELKLINITSLTFHNDFMDRLSVLYPGEDYTGYDINKIKCLIPLGLIDLSVQQQQLGFTDNILSLNENMWNDKLEYLSKNLLNRHRLSDHNLDTNFVSILEKIYGEKFDGYISPISWPTKIHGYFFPRELCIFKLEYLQEVTTYKRPSIGGSVNTNIICNPLDFSKIDYDAIQLKMNKEMKEILSKPINLFWNSHSEESFTSCKALTVKGGKRNTRKRNKNY